jgi:hypothetical protein
LPALLTDYIDDEPDWWESTLDAYSREPAVAFLREAVHISDAINQCRRRFQRRNDDSFNKDSQDSIYRLGAAALSSMMSHFETYQRLLFAGMVEASRFIIGFDLARFCKVLEKDAALELDLGRISAYRGQPTPIGRLLADNLTGWHSPATVNAYFKAIVHDYQFVSNEDGEELTILWQLRHSVVHTGGWLTEPDAQKVPALADLQGRPILLHERFIEIAARRLHTIVNRSTGGLGKKFKARLPADLENPGRREVNRLFKVQSPRSSWL